MARTRRERPTTITAFQDEVLTEIAKACLGDTCTGGCNHGWYEPLRGQYLRSARALEQKGLLTLTNGSHPRWVAGHVTAKGREFAKA